MNHHAVSPRAKNIVNRLFLPAFQQPSNGKSLGRWKLVYLEILHAKHHLFGAVNTYTNERSQKEHKIGGFLGPMGYPATSSSIFIHFRLWISLTKTIQLLGYPHDYGNPWLQSATSTSPPAGAPILNQEWWKTSEMSEWEWINGDWFIWTLD